MSRGRTQGEIAVANTLNFTVNKKSSRNQHTAKTKSFHARPPAAA
jgi:hypothetical protein